MSKTALVLILLVSAAVAAPAHAQLTPRQRQVFKTLCIKKPASELSIEALRVCTNLTIRRMYYEGYGGPAMSDETALRLKREADSWAARTHYKDPGVAVPCPSGTHMTKMDGCQ